ncbi:N-acetylglucosamine-6-phosphate deacetylase isoform X1 [Leptinotarsa decemlineata]|uniref:N-acetylglucosamine-6-phosphate deacetylase isoform X1 n=1 Tax=Leptinotarsa decemlineata TaxID=7539 RepID=UPI003D30B689
MSERLTQFVNCKILRNHKISPEDIWVRNGKIVDPEKIFFDEKVQADVVVDCKGNLIAPGFIELQINGGFGFDFSHHEHTEQGINVVAKNLLSHGITSFCPTVVTSPKEVYHKILKRIKQRKGDKNGATILGVHAEGPFISKEKKGAHPVNYIVEHDGTLFQFFELYGSLENIKIITLAPEFPNSDSVVKKLCEKNIVVSLGHSTANLAQGEQAVRKGATFITHLFNAMLPFHHRDPGLVGLLASDNIPKDKTIYFGIISDGIHTHPAALRIAYRVHPEGLVLVTDAISALGLGEGKYKIGQMDIEIREQNAYVAGTDTLCGSITSMIQCVRFFMEATGCGTEYALEAASLHPARVLGIEKTKGTLNFDADADFILLDDNLDIISTWIAGECVYEKL